MSQPKHVAIEGTVYFHFSANTTAGAAGDGASPTYDVRLCGGASDAAPVLSGTPTLLTGAGYADGSHEIAIAATAVNGFAAGNEYAVFCGLTISTVTPGGCLGTFRVVAAGDTIELAVARIMDVTDADSVLLDATQTAAIQ